MRYAIPTVDGKLALHFGHCREFAFVETQESEDGQQTITGVETAEPPPHAPGVLPAWLAEQGATVIIAGGMGRRAQGLFAQHDIEVVVGAPSESPEELVKQYIAGTLETGGNICDH
jgi:predicted Fe-Mo cluster-binding NifX family protein